MAGGNKVLVEHAICRFPFPPLASSSVVSLLLEELLFLVVVRCAKWDGGNRVRRGHADARFPFPPPGSSRVSLLLVEALSGLLILDPGRGGSGGDVLAVEAKAPLLEKFGVVVAEALAVVPPGVEFPGESVSVRRPPPYWRNPPEALLAKAGGSDVTPCCC